MPLPIKRGDAWINPSFPDVSLDLAGVVSLADISTSLQRTALTGTATLLDCLVLCPGFHLQQHADELNKGEHPAAAALTSGYVFRIENPATVYYLQKIGKTGSLTTVRVRDVRKRQKKNALLETLFTVDTANAVSIGAHAIAVSLTLAVLVIVGLMRDWWGLFVTLILVLARLLNVVLIRRRCKLKWSGAVEADRPGDLLVLLSQDRWIKIVGDINQIKAVSSGQWLQDMSAPESWMAAFATVLVYLNAALASNASQFGKVLLILLLIVSAGLLAAANQWTDQLQMHGYVLELAKGETKAYERRLHMVKDLVEQYDGNPDWALRLGLINPEDLHDRSSEEFSVSSEERRSVRNRGRDRASEDIRPAIM
ncbi:hypothetical protein P170DRAFT_449626 [Aspergillus steynii IBT 23096]|uniref:Uncharacterized protein n=1 Tax=Aspergillus steynii IBT 23096 TaxID=1392250 RepID=A0A2I2FZM5_9EURO|nr:uncharacterized protein P170DRAFT_449626 [Aspergillus steynii IBT 23096]PLB46085.1 hypothetical protein P170DRAFT_449626 [Aspergillus steynii IBT 23096]